jgi:hypothetical protein
VEFVFLRSNRYIWCKKDVKAVKVPMRTFLLTSRRSRNRMGVAVNRFERVLGVPGIERDVRKTSFLIYLTARPMPDNRIMRP